MRRMRRENRRPILRVRRRFPSHGISIAIHRIEARVAVPRFIEMDAVDALCESLLGGGRVVAHSVIRAVRQHRVDRALVAARLRKRIGGDAFLDGLGLERLWRNRTNDAVAIARRAQEHRDAARDGEALLDGLVAIAIAERKLVVTDARGHDGAIRCGRAVQHRVRALRAEDARDVALALPYGAAVAEERSERATLDAHVRAKEVLAVEIEERTANRRL